MFISLEGIEGVGKTTHLNFIKQFLQNKNISLITTREPGGTQMGEEIRNIILAHRHEQVSSIAELLLLFAARAQHYETVIKPALSSGQWVLCDRFTDATYAYQGGGRGINMDIIASLEKIVLGSFKPHLTIILDAPAHVGLNRVRIRGNHADRFEKEELEFFERVRKAYLSHAVSDPIRYKVIDATKSMNEVQQDIINIINKLSDN